MRINFALISLATVFIAITVPLSTHAHGGIPDRNEFYRGEVIKIIEEGINEIAGEISPYQIVQVVMRNGPHKNEILTIEYGKTFTLSGEHKVKRGDAVIINESSGPEGAKYYIVDRDRTSALILMAALFLGSAILFGRRKAISSIFGLLISLLILGAWVVPKIAFGGNPLFVSITGAFAIAFLSLYLAHGFNKRTTIALASTGITLVIAVLLAQIFVAFGKVSGLGAEETFYLQLGKFASLDFKGLLLGGIIIGTLGILDDITTAQVAVVHQLRQSNPRMPSSELYRRAFAVGQEHIASLVNTLALAYVGASLPLLLLFFGGDMPFWMTLNEEIVAEEIIRTLVGSTALIFAVPISTFLAARSNV